MLVTPATGPLEEPGVGDAAVLLLQPMAVTATASADMTKSLVDFTLDGSPRCCFPNSTES
jgi:hypothetical protein